MDSEIMESLSGFNALWQRVTGRETPEQSAPAEEETHTLADGLLRLIGGEACAASGAAALARMTQGEGRAALARQAAECRRRLRRLQAEYYILTGESAAAGPECQPVNGRRGCLRDAFLQAGRLAQLYRQTAWLADSPELAQTLEEFADSEQTRARQLRALLVESF